MTWLEQEIARNQKRIDRITTNPDATKIKANKLLYELERDLRIAQLDAWKTGNKPLINSDHLPPLVYAMGGIGLDMTGAADRTMLATEYFNVLRSNNFPDDACDRTIVIIALTVSKNFPPPNFVISTSFACPMECVSPKAIGEYYNLPIFHVDTTLETSDDALTYVADQIGELIEYAEAKVPGIKYSEERLLFAFEQDTIAHECAKQIHKLRKRVPCPLAGQDAFRLPRIPSMYPDPKKGAEYWKQFAEELHERAEKGYGVLEDEKLRFLWAVTGPFYFNPFDLLAKRGVAVPALQFGVMSRWFGAEYGLFGDETEYGRKLNPLEEMARFLNGNTWAGLGNRWVDSTVNMARDLKCDGIIYFLQLGCSASGGVSRLVAEKAERELGIPTLMLEGRQLDPFYKSQQESEEEMNAFIDLCLSKKQSKSK